MGFCINSKFIKASTSVTVGSLGDNLRAYWKLDETVGDTLYDVFGTYPGTRMGDTTLGVSGKINYAVSCDGSGDYVDFGSTVGDVGTSDFTIAGWIYLISSVNTYNGICGCWGDEPYYYLNFNESDYFRARFSPSLGVGVNILSDGGASLGTWYHMAVVFDRSDRMKMYINGSEQMDSADISSYSGTNIVNPNSFNIGNIGSALGGYFGHIRADCWGLWLEALSGTKISQLYNGGAGFDYPFI